MLYKRFKTYLEASLWKDTEEVVVFDVDEGGRAVHEDRSDVALLLLVHQHRHELVDHRHVDISPVVSADQHLAK